MSLWTWLINYFYPYRRLKQSYIVINQADWFDQQDTHTFTATISVAEQEVNRYLRLEWFQVINRARILKADGDTTLLQSSAIRNLIFKYDNMEIEYVTDNIVS